MTDPEPATLQFVDRHESPLETGTYTVTVTQALTAPQLPDGRVEFTAAHRFAVYGERFAFDAGEVVAAFPPPGDTGDHGDVLPHVVLSRATLPYERVAHAGSDPPLPWLALLVFTASEAPTPVAVTAGDLTTAVPGWPRLTLESAQHPEDAVTVVEVPAELLARLLPAPADLPLLTHVRRSVGGASDSGPAVEWSLVVSGRVAPVGETVVHLVSLEGRVAADATGALHVDLAGATEKARLVSLYSWRFTRPPTPPGGGLTGLVHLLTSLDHDPADLRLPDPPAGAPPVVTRFVERGYLACPHTLRGGGRTVSWYRGPLVPVGGRQEPATDRLPARTADALLRFHDDAGLLEVGAAAAWELGRLLAVGDQGFGRDLFAWRHRLTRSRHDPVAGPIPPPSPVDVDLPASVLAWLERTALLEGVPFGYLVPDERMLPVESLRRFEVDPAWIAALLDGALAAGRVTRGQQGRDLERRPEIARLGGLAHSGVLVRSAAVAGWPALLAEGCRGDGTVVAPLRTARLSSSVLLALWPEPVVAVRLRLPPEALHFGLPAGTRPLREADGRPRTDAVTTVPMRDPELGVVDVTGLARAMVDLVPGLHTAEHPFGPGVFAMEMVEGTPSVEFGFAPA